MPSFDFETKRYLERSINDEDEHFKMRQKLEDSYRHGRDVDEDLHLACTLDQSYYMSLDASTDTKNQVVFRHTAKLSQAWGYAKTLEEADQKPAGDTADHSRLTNMAQTTKRKEPKLLMVSQFWLW